MIFRPTDSDTSEYHKNPNSDGPRSIFGGGGGGGGGGG